MWWRFVVFCFLVSFILFLVLNYLHGRPVTHFKFFRRNDGADNEIVYEHFKDNFLKERLVAFEFDSDNGTFVPADVDIEEIIEVMRDKLNVHDPDSRNIVASLEELFNETEYSENNLGIKIKYKEIDKEFEYGLEDKIDLGSAEHSVTEDTKVFNVDDKLLTTISDMDNVAEIADTSKENDSDNIDLSNNDANINDAITSSKADYNSIDHKEISRDDVKNETSNEISSDPDVDDGREIATKEVIEQS